MSGHSIRVWLRFGVICVVQILLLETFWGSKLLRSYLRAIRYPGNVLRGSLYPRNMRYRLRLLLYNRPARGSQKSRGVMKRLLNKYWSKNQALKLYQLVQDQAHASSRVVAPSKSRSVEPLTLSTPPEMY